MLDRHPATGNKRTVRVLPLGFAIVEFKEERETGRYAEIGLAKNNKMSDV